MAFARRLGSAVARLRRFPEFGARVEEIDDPQLREFLYKNHRIFYRFDGTAICILAVYHGAQLIDPQSLLE
jgi:plasmid stabilization system protein ParE